MTPETKLKNAVKKHLDSLGEDCWYFKVIGGPRQKAGVPDLIGCYKGRFIAIEIKAANGKLSKKQEREIAAIRAAGGVAFVPYSLEQAIGYMESIL